MSKWFVAEHGTNGFQHTTISRYCLVISPLTPVMAAASRPAT
jgi:hypothetical protein